MRAPPARPSAKTGIPRPVTLWLWASVSAGLHVALILGFSFFGGGGRFVRGAGLPTGDGFGGTSVELEIAGPEEGAPQGAISAGQAPAPEPPAEPEPPAATETAPALTGELPVQMPEPAPEAPAEREAPVRREAARREAREAQAAREAPTGGDPSQETVAAPGPNDQARGSGADDSTAGTPGGDASSLILGAAGGLGDSASARRALLPNGGRCEDPVAGVWRAQKFRARDRSWVRFVLRIRREGDALRGTITSRIWTGSPMSAEPGPCTAFGFDHTWRMTARGRLDGTTLTFGARSATLVEQHCPSADARYAADNFTGTIDPLRDTFESRNNDGAFDIDEPYTFRRVSCD